jgi:Transposase
MRVDVLPGDCSHAFGMAVSGDTVLRHLKRCSLQPDSGALRVVGIDDWSWRKGQSYGTIMVDLERRTVVDVLADRSSSSVAAWFSARPSIEVISRDRQGLYAEGARVGAPQARQVADRFHLVQNLREMIEKQLGRLERPLRAKGSVAIEDEDTRAGLHRLRQVSFEQVRLLYDAGKTATAITEELGLSRERVDKWIRLQALPERNAMAPTPRSPAYYQGHLSRRWPKDALLSVASSPKSSASASQAATRIFHSLSRRGGGRQKEHQAISHCTQQAFSPETLRQDGRCHHRSPPVSASSRGRS